MTNTDNSNLMMLTAQIVSAHLSNNPIPPDQVQKLIRDVHDALGNIANVRPALVPEPAVPIKESVRADSIACLECGKPFQMLKRHLNTDHKLTPMDYRVKWNLAATYPMVAPNYAKVRSRLAIDSGLGRGPRKPVAPTGNRRTIVQRPAAPKFVQRRKG